MNHERLAGVASLLPNEFTALTLKLCWMPACNLFAVRGGVRGGTRTYREFASI
jgi:hypothetical protein